jgi:membrane peptidoglycan carboxypeptidase
MSENARFKSKVLVKLALTIAVAGALVAGLMLPFIGGSGIVARNSASLLDALPVELTDQTPAGMTKVLASDGSLLTYFYEVNRTPVKSDQISDVMKQALVDIEDSRFYAHNGLDVEGTVRALARNLAAGSVTEGGSTITQQLVKQTLLQTATTQEERDAAVEQEGVSGLSRKLREARLALALEETYSKDEILTRYLNIVYFGQGAYGIHAAAKRYFSTSAKKLDLAQAAVLAGLVQSPGEDDPITNPEQAQARRNQVLTRMNKLGHITDAQLAELLPTPVKVKPGQPPARGCIGARVGAFFCAYMHDYVTSVLKISDEQLETGGLTIKTTLRPDMQKAGDQAVLNTLKMGDRLAGTYTAVEPGTGRILAMAVNRQYGCEGKPECESVVLNSVASRGAGSTYKVFTAAAALEAGYSKYYTLTTPALYTSRVFKSSSGQCAPQYCVENAGVYPRTLDLEKALYMSSNTYFVALEDALGSIKKPAEMARRMGMRFDRPNQIPLDTIIGQNNGSFTLGPYATSPLDLASAYSTLAANGTQCDPIPVTEILDHDGKPLTKKDGSPLVPESTCEKDAIPQGVATTLNQILRKDVEPGFSGQTASRAYIPGHQIAGKTGTAQGNISVAFVGYTPEYTASVMVFDPKTEQDVGGFGGGKGATIWHDAMQPILSKEKTAAFPKADPKVENGNTRQVPSCGSVGGCEAALAAAGFRSEVSYIDDDAPEGTFLGTSPGAGSRAVQKQVITILVSNGSDYVAPKPKPSPDPTPTPTPKPKPKPTPPTGGGGGGGGGGAAGGGGHGGGG